MAARILAYLRGTPSTPTQTPKMTREEKVNNYLTIFQEAIQNQRLPQYDPHNLAKLKSKVDNDNKTSYETREDLELVLWMEHSLKNSEYIKASFIDGRPNLEILPKALEMRADEINTIIKHLLTFSKVNCSVVVKGKTYTREAIVMFLALGTSPNSLSPETTYTLKFKDGKSRECTLAELYFLGLHTNAIQRAMAFALHGEPVPEETCFNFPDVEDQTIQLLYDLFTLNPAVFLSTPPSDQLSRLLKYLDKPEVDKAFLMRFFERSTLFVDPAAHLQRTQEIVLSEDCLERENFQAETQAILKACPQATQVTIRQRGDFLLKLPRETFEQFLNNDPAFFKNRKIKCKNNETVEVACDFYLQAMTYRSEANTLSMFNDASEIDLSEHDKGTIEHAYQWFKTGKYPTLSWREEAKLVAFLNYCSPDEENPRAVLAFSSLSKKTPCFTVDEVTSMSWEELFELLEPYPKHKFIQLGKEVYQIANLTKLRNIPLQNLAKPIYLKLPNESIVEGSLEWLSNPAAFLDSSQENPIPVTEEILRSIYEHSKTPLTYCQLKQRHKFFIKHAETPRAILQANIKLMKDCTLVNPGNAALPTEKYWSGVAAELHNLHHAKEIQLAGCEIVWPRGIVQAFIAHGNIPIEALSEMITLKFSDKEKGTTIHRIYKAEWMCFTDKEPSDIQSSEELDGVIYCLDQIRKQMRGTKEFALLTAWGPCKRTARSFFQDTIERFLQGKRAGRDAEFTKRLHLNSHQFGNPPSTQSPPPAGNSPPWKVVIPLVVISAMKKIWDHYQPSVSTVKDLVLNKYTIVIGGCAIAAAYYIFSNRQRIRNAWERTTWKRTIAVVGGLAGAGAVGLLWMRFGRKD